MNAARMFAGWVAGGHRGGRRQRDRRASPDNYKCQRLVQYRNRVVGLSRAKGRHGSCDARDAWCRICHCTVVTTRALSISYLGC